MHFSNSVMVPEVAVERRKDKFEITLHMELAFTSLQLEQVALHYNVFNIGLVKHK